MITGQQVIEGCETMTTALHRELIWRGVSPIPFPQLIVAGVAVDFSSRFESQDAIPLRIVLGDYRAQFELRACGFVIPMALHLAVDIAADRYEDSLKMARP